MTGLSTLYLLHYNNYYNRIVKREDTLSDYMPYVIGSPIQKINFIPNDGVMTEQIVNWRYEHPDYLLVVDEEGYIDSRWFVVSEIRERSGQLRLTLRRDLVADYYDKVIEAPTFIEKATLEDSDPMIFNSEDMTFNQIKTSETPLTDETNSAWIVGYITSKTTYTDENNTEQPLNMEVDIDFAMGADEAVSSISEYKYYQYSNLSNNRQDLVGFPSKIAFCVYALEKATVLPRLYKVCFNESGGQPLGPVQVSATGGTYTDVGYGHCLSVYSGAWNPTCRYTGLTWASGYEFTLVDKWVKAFSSYYSTLRSQLPSYLPIQTEQDTIELNNENGKIIYDASTQKYYKVSITKQQNTWGEVPIQSGNMYNTFISGYNARANSYDREIGNTTGKWNSVIMGNTTPNSSTFAVRTYGAKYKVELTEIPGPGGSGYKAQISANRYHLNDAPYDMFAIPYSNDLTIYKNGTALFKANKDLAFKTVMSLVRKYQSAGYIYDVQLLPFCPIRSMIKPNGTFDIGDNIVDYITYNIVEKIGVIVYASTSSGTFNIPMSITWEEGEKKIAAMCDMHRLCSPNYNGQFEFNVAMNDGVEYFNVDFTYKPYNPYIHINPNFGGLYGEDFNDSRGLVCGGEFSLPAVSDAWSTYELQNKNYQNMFDRQIQNMQLNNAVQSSKDQFSAIMGTVGGGLQGAAAGGMVGGPWGAAAGAVIGTATSAVGGILDVYYNNLLRNEALDYTKDMFGYQLANIRALPYTLTRTTAFTYNNKIFPILEYYTCTPQEKDALRQKIKYNGMTVMRIGKIIDYLREEPTYIKGRLIRLEDIEEDYHITTALADEMFKGVFI